MVLTATYICTENLALDIIATVLYIHTYTYKPHHAWQRIKLSNSRLVPNEHHTSHPVTSVHTTSPPHLYVYTYITLAQHLVIDTDLALRT